MIMLAVAESVLVPHAVGLVSRGIALVSLMLRQEY